MTLITLQDRADVVRAAEQQPDALAGELLAWDLSAHLELQDRDLPHLTPWDIVGPGDMPAARRCEQAAQAFWQAHAHIPFLGLDLLALARFRHVACLARLAWNAFVIRRALDLLAPDAVYVFADAGGHGLEQPPGCTRQALLQPLVQGICDQAGIAVRRIADGPAPFRDLAAEQACGNTGPAIDLARELAGRPYVAFAGSEADLIRQLPLIGGLRAANHVEVVQLYRTADAATLAALRAAGHRVYHETQILGLRGSGLNRAPQESEAIESAALDAARAAWERAAGDVDAELAGVVANPHLATHFDFIFGDYARRMATQVAAWQGFLDHCSPRAVVCNYPTTLIEVATRRGIPGLLLPHGVMTAGDVRWYACLPPVTIGAASAAHLARLERSGLGADRIRVTGDPGLAAPRAGDNVQPAAGPSGGPRRILLITSALAAPAHQSDLPQINWRTGVETFAALGRLARRRGDWQFTIRPHPRYDQVELYQRLHRYAPADRRWRIAADTPLADLVRAADAVVVVNNRSSAIVEASLLGAPVYLLCPDMIAIDLVAWGLDAWPRIRSVDALEHELTALFADLRHRDERLEETRTAVERFIGEEPQSGTARCVAAVAKLAGWATPDAVTPTSAALT